MKHLWGNRDAYLPWKISYSVLSVAIPIMVSVSSLGLVQLTDIGRQMWVHRIGRQEEVVEKLTANTANVTRFVSYKSREEGIEDLRELAKYSRFEEMYAYLPGKNKWVELGIYEKVWKDELGENARAILEWSKKRDLRNIDNVEMYHNHPIKLKSNFLEKRIEEITLSNPEVDPEMVRYNYYAIRTLPAVGDAADMIPEAQFKHIVNKKGSLEFIAVSIYGDASYSLAEKTLGNDSYKNMIGLRNVRKSFGLDLYNALDANKDYSKKSITKIIEQQFENYAPRYLEHNIKISFTPAPQ